VVAGVGGPGGVVDVGATGREVLDMDRGREAEGEKRWRDGDREREWRGKRGIGSGRQREVEVEI
jgi:hypothetical protein